MAPLRRIINSFTAPADPKASFQGKTIIVTGGNTGLGLEAAIKFVNLNAAKVIITSRNIEKGLSAKSQIDSRTGRGDSVEVWQLDMNSYDSIKSFAKRAASELDHLGIVVLSAGISPRHFTKSPMGWELEVVAARVHESVNLSPEQRNPANILESFNVSKEEDYIPLRQYSTSKLFLMYAVQALADMVTAKDGEPDVIITAVCPGACKSELARDYDGGAFKVLKSVAGALILKTAEEGARNYIIGVTKGKESYGCFIQNDEIRPPAQMLVGEEGKKLQKKIWNEIIEALGKDVPEVIDFVETRV